MLATQYVQEAYPRLSRLSDGSPRHYDAFRRLVETFERYQSGEGFDLAALKRDQPAVIAVYESGGAMVRLIKNGESHSPATETLEYPAFAPPVAT